MSDDRPIITYRNKVSGAGAVVDTSFSPFTNQPTFSLGSGQAGVTCSYAGGCVYSITGGAGVAASTLNDKVSISVCGQTCEVDHALSDGNDAYCRLSPLATAYSAGEFDIVKSAELDIAFTGTGDDMAVLSDGVNTVDSNDSSSSDCEIRADAKTDYTYSLDAVRVFFN